LTVPLTVTTVDLNHEQNGLFFGDLILSLIEPASLDLMDKTLALTTVPTAVSPIDFYVIEALFV
jgi:hypothetical protein